MSRGPFRDYRVGDRVRLPPPARGATLSRHLALEVEWSPPVGLRVCGQYALELLACALLDRGLIGFEPSLRIAVPSPGVIRASILAYEESE